MARLDINDSYVIISDPHQWIVYSKGTHKADQKVSDDKEGVKAGDEKLTFVGSVHTIKQAFTFLLQRQIKESSASGFTAIMEEVKRIEEEIKLAIAI